MFCQHYSPLHISFLEVAFFGCIRKQDWSYFDSKICWFITALCQKRTQIFQKIILIKSLKNLFKARRGLVFWFQKSFLPSVRNFLKLQSLEQFIQTMKDQSNFSNRMFFDNSSSDLIYLLKQFKLGTIHKGRLLKGVGRWVHQRFTK